MGLKSIILGIAQDGGIPQASLSPLNWDAFQRGDVHYPVSLGVKTVDGSGHLFDVTRSLSWQLALWQNKCEGTLKKISDVWISHSHLSHVDGLRQFGEASMGLKGVNIRCSKLFANEIKSNDWINQLIKNGTFILKTWDDQSEIILEEGFSVRPIRVPHRNIGSDTHCFLIKGISKALLYLSDHDNWDATLDFVGHETPLQWFSSIGANIVLLDGTFWSLNELRDREQNDVPHPPVSETLKLIGDRKSGDPEIFFLHLNHTNPLLDSKSNEFNELVTKGWNLAEEGQVIEL